MKRNTVQREIILETLRTFDTHPTVEEVYLEVHKRHPAISKVTVYRNLRQLTENGLVGRVLLQEELERYDKRAEQHYHFKCKNCDTLFDVDIDYPREMDETVRQKYGFQVDKHDVVFWGICPKCKADAPNAEESVNK